MHSLLLSKLAFKSTQFVLDQLHLSKAGVGVEPCHPQVHGNLVRILANDEWGPKEPEKKHIQDTRMTDTLAHELLV